MNDGLYLDGLGFENAKGVTISFWMSMINYMKILHLSSLV